MRIARIRARIIRLSIAAVERMRRHARKTIPILSAAWLVMILIPVVISRLFPGRTDPNGIGFGPGFVAAVIVFCPVLVVAGLLVLWTLVAWRKIGLVHRIAGLAPAWVVSGIWLYMLVVEGM